MKKKYIIILFFVISIVFIYISFNKKESIVESNKTILEEKKIIDSFDKMVFEFNKDFKKALISARNTKIDETKEATKATLDLWRGIVNKYISEQPSAYRKTKEWTSSLKIISEALIKADEYAQSDKTEKVVVELERIRRELRMLRRDNSIFNISDSILDFEEIVMEIKSKETKDEILIKTPELKYYFTQLKEYNLGEEYNSLLLNIEEVLGKIDKLDGPDFRKAKEDLVPLFEKMYFLFG